MNRLIMWISMERPFIKLWYENNTLFTFIKLSFRKVILSCAYFKNFKNTYFEKQIFSLFFYFSDLLAYRNSWTLDVRAGRWTLDAGLWTLGTGRWTLDAGLWMLDSGHWTLDVGLWTLDFGRWTLYRRR